MATITHACAMPGFVSRAAMPCSASQKHRILPCRAAASEDSSKPERSKGIFGFVTDNASSRNAIQLPNTPAQDGNLGQMITEIENKGREFGSYKRAGEFSWFVRETVILKQLFLLVHKLQKISFSNYLQSKALSFRAVLEGICHIPPFYVNLNFTGSPDAKNGTVIFLHGAPTQSYSYRVVLQKMAEAGYHCYAPDWIGYGFSERPQPVYYFSYTEEAYHEEFDKLLNRIGVDAPFYLVTQGFLVGSYGLTWALKNPERVAKLVVLNGPLSSSAPLPGIFNQLRLPFVGEFTCQNAMLAERFVEGGSTYVLELNDADVYRLPYLDSSDPGFALLESARKAPLKDLTTRIETGFSSGRWSVPTLVAWGVTDKYLPSSEAENFAKRNAGVIKAELLEGAGHLPQEDWPEKVVDALTKFL